MNKILIPLNPQQNLENLQEYALWLAEVLEAQLVPLYVVPAPDDIVGLGEVTEVAAVDEALKSIGINKLKSFERKVGEIQHEAGLLRRGNRVETILEIALEERVALIVLPGFSTRLSRTLLGSDVERIVEYSTASVLVLREEHEVPQRGQRMLVPFSGHVPSINACERILDLAGTMGLSVTLVAVSRDTGETVRLLETVRDDWHRQVPNCDVEIGVEVHLEHWPLGSQRRLASYGVAEPDVALVVLPRVAQGEVGDAADDLLHLFLVQTRVPVLILH